MQEEGEEAAKITTVESMMISVSRLPRKLKLLEMTH